MRAPGYYTLDEDLVNPEPDRRKRYDWSRATRFPKGSLFQVTNWDNIRRYQRGTDSAYAVGPGRKSLFMALEEAAMTPRIPTLAERLEALQLYPMEVLEFLNPTDEQLQACVQHLAERDR
jgi:hypothetical protein